MEEFTTEMMIEQMTSSLLGPKPSARERFVTKNALTVLVWLAKSECRIEINKSVGKATSMVVARSARRDAKAAIRKAAEPAVQPDLVLRLAR